MAEAKKSEAEAAAAPPKKSKRKLIIFIVVGLLVVALAAGGAFFMLKKNDAKDGGTGAEGTHETGKRKIADNSKPPVFYKFEKAFTVKLQTEAQEAYLQTEVQLKLLDSSDQELVKQYEPELKHRITLTLMSKKASDFAAGTGVQRLANQLRDVSNEVVGAPPATRRKTVGETEPADAADPDSPVQSVLFSTFIIQ